MVLTPLSGETMPSMVPRMIRVAKGFRRTASLLSRTDTRSPSRERSMPCIYAVPLNEVRIALTTWSIYPWTKSLSAMGASSTVRLTCRDTISTS